MIRTAIAFWLAASCFAAAGLKFETQEKELRAPVESSSVTIDFPFKNESDHPVEIARYDGGCTCSTVMVSGGKVLYAPGESGVIRAAFDLGNFSGSVDKVVSLWLKGDPDGEPSVRLKVRIHIPVLVETDPKTLRWDVGETAEPKSISITMNGEKPIKVLSVSSTLPLFSHELKTIEEGRKYELVVTPEATDKPALTIFRIQTDCEVQRHSVAQTFAVVRTPLPGEAAQVP
jgi:hypothetical protein